VIRRGHVSKSIYACPARQLMCKTDLLFYLVLPVSERLAILTCVLSFKRYSILTIINKKKMI